MSHTEKRRVCASCGKELTRRDCRKDRQGEYFCPTCYNQSPRQCACCGTETTRGNCHRNRYGEYICRSCHEQGKRASRGRSLRKWTRRYSRWALYLPVALAGFWIAYRVFSMMVEKFSSTGGEP
jgi:hypothetical protein